MIDPQFDVELKVLADKYQVQIRGVATPVDTDLDTHDFNVFSTPAQ